MPQDLATILPPALAVPVLLASWAGMILLPWLLLRRTGIHQSSESLSLAPDPILPPLPASLRVIDLPPVRYPVDTASAQVLDVSSAPHPGVMRLDTLRVYTSTLDVVTWTLTGGGVEILAGQIVSIVVRKSADGRLAPILVYNHNSGLAAPQTPNLNSVHRAGSPLALPLGALAGTVGCAGALAWGLAAWYGPRMAAAAFALLVLGGGVLCAATLAWFLTRSLELGIVRLRNRRFMRSYAPRFRGYFKQCTPALQMRFEPR